MTYRPGCRGATRDLLSSETAYPWQTSPASFTRVFVWRNSDDIPWRDSRPLISSRRRVGLAGWARQRPAKVAYPSAFGASTYASSRPLNGSLATSNSPPRVTEPLPASTPPAGRPVGPPVHHPVPNLDENPPPLAAAPSSLSVAPSGNRAEQLTTTAASWTAIGPMP